MAKGPKQVDALRHDRAKRINVPTAEMAPLYEQQAEREGGGRVRMRIPRDRPLAEGETRTRDGDLDPQIVWNGVRISLTKEQVAQLAETGTVEIGDAQLVWRGKDAQDWSDLVVNAPPLYIQEKVHPKAIIDDLRKEADRRKQEARSAAGATGKQIDLFADFNGLDDIEARAEFYQHAMNWQNRMILGDSLQVMASLARREGLKGQVQCIYIDPPYGIRFNSNWQVSTLSRDVKDGKVADVSREPEQVKAFRDTWKDGIHSYLTYLRDRLTVARELLTESGSVFVQIGDENVHRVRALMDEVFGEENFISAVTVTKTAGATSDLLAGVADYVIWFSKNHSKTKFRRPYFLKEVSGQGGGQYTKARDQDGVRRNLTKFERNDPTCIPAHDRVFRIDNMTSQRPPGDFPVNIFGRVVRPSKGYWKTGEVGMVRLAKANRLELVGNTLSYVRFIDDFRVFAINNVWADTGASGFGDDKLYVVQTISKIVERCILMTTDPGDLVLDPTCGAGTTATVAEQWGRRWITIDTSRVALALARARLMGARYPYYLLADSAQGRAKEQQITGRVQPDVATHGDVRHGFVYERAPHIALKSIANNAEIDVIWEKWQETLEPLRAELNEALGTNWEEWEIPRDLDEWAKNLSSAAGGKRDRAPAGQAAPAEASAQPTAVSEKARQAHSAWWEARIARQKEIDAAIARAADIELLYDRPYPDNTRVRVAGPFTVESLSPHRIVTALDDTLADETAAYEGRLQRGPRNMPEVDFGEMVLEHLKTAGVHQQAKADTIHFSAIEPWPGKWIAADGRYTDAEGEERRAAILIGPEFGTLSRTDITAAAREAAEARFDALIACAFNFDAQASDLTRLGPLAILKARMNPDLHMAEDLKNTGKGNLFVVFGEPDVDLLETEDGMLQVKVNGIDVFDPSTGEIRSDDASGIAAWFIDTDYDEESFFVRHAYFLGAGDPYKALKTALRAEIDEDAWASLYSDTSRPFARPGTGRIAVKVINHFGDEVLKVFGVG